MKRSIRQMLVAAAAACVLCPAMGQTFPDRPVHVVVPQLPGGSSDLIGRILAEYLREKWKQPVLIENRVGANGNIGTDYVAKSAPNGYTWLLTYSGSHAINPALYKKLPYDPQRDLIAVATVAQLPFVLVSHPDLPVRDVKDLVALAKSKPGQLNYGAQNGAINHLIGEIFNRTAGVKTVQIPYKGAPDSLVDTVSGLLQFNYASLGSVIQFIRSNKVRPLAVTSAKRSAFLKDVPTVAEAGYPALTTDSWWGILLPTGTPPDIVNKINADVNEALRRPELMTRFATFGAEPYLTSPEQFAKVANDDIVRFRAIVEQSGVRSEQ